MSVSPTLREDGGYLSILARVPAPLAERIVAWRRAHGVTDDAASSSHITVLIAREKDDGCPLARLRAEFSGHGAVLVQLGEPASFQPAAPVTYLPLLGAGAACFTEIHEHSTRLIGESASPFPYEPHLTLANGLEPQDLAASLNDFKALPAHLCSFEVSELGVYRFDQGTWEHVGDVPLT